MADPSHVSFSDSLTLARRTAFYERHKPIAVVMILLVFLLPFFGVSVRGWIGAAARATASGACYHRTPYLGYPHRGPTTGTAAEILSFLFRSANLPYNACCT